MKIPSSVRKAFQEQLDLNGPLRRHVDQTMNAIKHPGWHYESRLKELESFAVKLETGRVDNPHALEDFLACMIVVPNSDAIARAVNAVEDRFEVAYRRPKKPGSTNKPPDAFPFDDLRLYCKRTNNGDRPADPIDGMIFEVQIKTFLQHAWSIATHDLTYKSDAVTWGQDRVVANLKAALEHVELSLQEASQLSKSPLVALHNPRTDQIAEIISVLAQNWLRDDLPRNLRGLAETLSPILYDLSISPRHLHEMLQASAPLPLNLSPYAAIMSILLRDREPALTDALEADRGRFRIFLTPEVDKPANFPSDRARPRVVMLSAAQ